MAIYCAGIHPQGQLKHSNKESELQKELIQAFPAKLNKDKGSIIYDQLFTDKFKQFFGDWTSSDPKWVKWYNSSETRGMLNTQGEPKLYTFQGEKYFVDSKGQRYVIDKRYLSAKDKIETINSLSLLYVNETQSKKDAVDIQAFVRRTLEKRYNALLNKINELEVELEDNEDSMEEDDIQANEAERASLKRSKNALKKDLLDNLQGFKSIVSGIEQNLADFDLKYIDEVEDKEDDDSPMTNDEISTYTREGSEVRDTNNIDSEIKSIISSIADYDVDINNNETPKYSKLLKLPMSRNANTVKNLLVETMSNIIEVELAGNDYISDPYDLMIDKLKERLNENGDLIIRDFLYKVDKIYKSKSKNDQEAFKTKFVTSFYKAQNVFTITEISVNNSGKLTLRHIDPASSQDKEAFIGNEFTRSILNKFNYSTSKKEVNNIEDYNKAKKLLLNFKTKQDIVNGLESLGITLNNKTINSLFRNKENVLSKYSTQIKSLKDLFKDLFDQEIKYRDPETNKDRDIASKGLKNVLEAYSKSTSVAQGNIVKQLVNKDNLTPFNILSKYEAINKNDLSDSSLFVGNKQRWMFSLVSGLNKEILSWKAGNLNSLLKKKHKNLIFVNYLLDLDNVERGIYTENSPENIAERTRRISNLKLIINSELKNPNDANPIQHKEIGEADLHMDIFFKMFNNLDEIYESLDNQQGITQQIKNASNTKVINNYPFSADKSGSYGIFGFAPMDNNVTVNAKQELVDLGSGNQQIIKNYLLGEFEVMKRSSDLIQSYLNKKTKAQKQAFAMKYLIADYHYASSYKDLSGNTIDYDIEQGLDYNFFNAGTWNKFGFFNSSYNNNKAQFDLLFKNDSGVKLADANMTSHITDNLFKLVEKDLIDVANKNKDYLDNIIAKQDFNGKKSVLDLETNIVGSREAVMHYNYAVNSIFSNLEMFSLFNGDLAFYKQKGANISMEDALKRGPAILTDGLYIRQTKTANNTEYTSYNNEKIKVDKNKFAVTAVLNNLENKTSKYAEQISKAAGNNMTYAHEIADAQGYITLDFYKRIISGTYGWKDSDEAHFQSLKDKSHVYTDSNIKWLKSAGRSLQALKLTGFNLQDITNEKGDIIGQNPVYLKYSTAVLAPAIIGGTDVEKLLKAMESQGVDQVVFKSGSKASNPQPTTIFKKDDKGIFDGLDENMKLNPFVFNLSGLKLQVELPTKFDHDGVLGNQHLKNLIANLDLTNIEKIYKYRNQMLSGKELQEQYDRTILNILQSQLDNFINKIDIQNNDNIKSFDQTKLRELIIDQLDANTDEDLIDILRDNSLPLETVPGIAQRAFPIISSYIQKNVSKVRTNAGSAIQVANIGFDRVDNPDANNIIYLTEDRELRPPLPAIDPITKRKYIAKARIMLPFSSIYEKTGMDYNQFKKAFEDGKIDARIFQNLIGYRIPNQSISSNDSIEIVGILPPSMGDSAIVYHEITAKTGSDFDIDKMYLMLPNFEVTENNEVKYIDNEDSNKGQQNKLIELMGSILENTASYDDLISPLDSDIPKDAINEVLYLKSIVKDEDYEDKLKSFNSLKGDNKSKFLKTFAEGRKLSPYEQLSPMGMVRSRVDMLQAKKLVATMANHMTDIPMSQIVNQILKYDLRLGSSNFNNIYTIGQENNNEYKLTKIVSYLMNAAVDAAKDNYIIEGNFNSYTANGAMVMIRLGIDPVNVFKVLLNNDVIKLSKLKQLQTQKITNINTDEYKQETLNDYSKALLIHLQTNKINFNDFIKQQENFDSKLTLGLWNIIQLAGKELNNDIINSKSDSNGAGKNIAEHTVLYNRLQRLAVESVGSDINGNFTRGLKLFKNGLDLDELHLRTSLFEKEDLTFLGGMMNNGLFLTNFIAKNMFLEATNNYRYIVNRIANQLGDPLTVAADNVKLISNYIYPYIISQSGHKLYNIDEGKVDFLTKEFLNEVIDKKAAFPNNEFLKQLYIDASTNLISFPNYKYFGVNEKILLKGALNDIYNQRDINNKLTGPEFINKLVSYAFLTTGFKPTYFAMNEYLPKSYFLNTGHGANMASLIEKMNYSSEFKEDESIEKMLTFMAINNETNYKVVGNLFKSEGLSSNKPLTNKITLEKVKIKGTDNFYPFVRDKQNDRLMMLTDITDYTNKEGKTYKVPTYNLINSNSEEVDTENNKNIKRKTKVKLFDLNTIKESNLFKGSHSNSKLYIQPEIVYTSELANIFGTNNLNVANDNIAIQRLNNMQENTYGLSQEAWDNLTEKEQNKLKTQEEEGCNN